MAVYSRLSLSAGGGIISTQQLAEQTKNTATILIGLGGTGVDCLRTIKTQVYTRLKPDDVNAVKPEYSHIRFLGVDTTDKTKGENKNDNSQKGILALDDTEFFSIKKAEVAASLSSPKALETKPELKWLEYENIDTPSLSDAGAGGIRQVGRYMLMDKSNEFMAKLERELRNAKSGMNAPRVNVHILAGLSGGTGSGCFLDVCYMVRALLAENGGGTVFGYCFLPDVNLSKIPTEATALHEYIPKNGYAAMKELDYCMGLPKNGGSFEQVYQGGRKIKWNQPPMDMCHLVCATNEHNAVIPNAYDYAMNVTAEYILDFLTHSDDTFGLAEHLSNFQSMTASANGLKLIGSKMNYIVIGASSASLPLKEINTYLASELFEKFSRIGANVPTKADVEELTKAALAKDAAGISDLYLSILRELRDSAGDDYVSYQDDWKFVLNFGNSDLIKHYTNQTAAKLNRTEANAKSLTTETNNLSLSARVRTELVRILRDVNKGPIYAYKMLSAAESHNLLNIVDGLIEENTSRWNQEAAQADLRSRDYETAKRIFETRHRRNLLDNDAKRFSEYEWFLMLFEQHKLNMSIYRKYDEVLTIFRKQIEQMTSNYYIKLSRIMNNLIETFKENRNALKSLTGTSDTFSIPLMTISELRKPLDNEIEKIDVSNMMDQFMSLFVDKEDEWKDEDENKISRLVNNFFVETAFHDFGNRTITAFLKDKYEQKHGAITDAQLANYIYEDWMGLLTEKASPLFSFNTTVQSPTTTTKLAFLSFPSISAPIKAAAEQMHNVSDLWKLKESALTDRIFVMCSACGLPLSAYKKCEFYENKYYTEVAVGRHYYESKPIKECKFSDWRNLPSLMPRKLIESSQMPPRLKKILDEMDGAYEKIKALNVIDDQGFICKPSTAAMEKLKMNFQICQQKYQDLDNVGQIEELQDTMKALENSLNLPMERMGEYQLPQDGKRDNQEDIESLNKDIFVYSPAFKVIAEEVINEFESIVQRAEALLKEAEEKIQKVRAGSEALKDYCDALFTGVIAIEGRTICYKKVEFGISNEITLSKRGEDFKFGAIPVYQGYISYQALADELKAEMKKLADERYNNDEPEVHSSGQILKEALSDDKVAAWAQLAAEYENKGDIIEFLTKMKQRFYTFCLEYGI